ncbi:hypothetical protein J0H58_21435 [bacterium]|nr:hypothetical protein [bacterium]
MTDHLTHLHPAEMTPAERASAVVALLAAGLLRHLDPEHFPAPTQLRILRKSQANRLEYPPSASVTVRAG